MLRSPLIALAAGFVLLGGIIVSIAIFASGVQTTNAALMRSLERNLMLARLVSQVQGAETGQRGFLLTGDRAYIDSHAAAMSSVDDTLAAIEDVSDDSFAFLPENIAKLKAAVRAKMDELQQTIDLAQGGQREQAIAIVDTDRGESLMMAIRDVVAAMRARSTAALDAEIARERTAVFRLWAGIAAAALGIVLLAALLIRDARQRLTFLTEQSAALAERNIALQSANERLAHEMAQRAAAEDQVRQLQKMEAIGQLTGGIAHDFNNVLAVVLSAIGLVRRRIADGDYDVTRFLDGASEAAERAATLIKRLLAFARQQPLEPEVLDPNKLVQNMSELLRSTLGEAVILETVLGGGVWRIHADARQLENSIINLAVNARDAMPDGGRLTIESANVYLDEAYVIHNPGASARQYVMIAVSDTGSGMPEEVAARAFDPFFTTKEAGRGTGLGLSQVYGFIKQSHGHIKIYSELGAGTTVKMYVPRHLGDAGVQASAPATKGPAKVGKSWEVIVVAEDDEGVRGMVADALSDLGYTVVAASNGDEALAMIVARKEEVSLLLTDIVMPGMSGRQLADETAKILPKLKVLYTTGFTRNAVVHNGVLDAGVNFMPKPFTVDELAAKVRQILDA